MAFGTSPHRSRNARAIAAFAGAVFVVLACRGDKKRSDPEFLSVSTPDAMIAPGVPLRLTGTDLRGIEAILGDRELQVRLSDRSHAEVEIPVEVFAPCSPAGIPYNIELRRGGSRRTLTLRTADVPLKVDLSTGQHQLLTRAVERGCAVILPDSGEYLVMPFTWDHATDIYAEEVAPVSGRVSMRRLDEGEQIHTLDLRNLSEPRTVEPYLEAAGIPVAADFSTRGVESPDQLKFRFPADMQLPGPSACTHSLGLGDRLQIGTVRDRWGLFHGLHGDSAVSEPWQVVGVSPRLLVLFDEATLRRARGNPSVRARLVEFMSAYDSVVAPFFNELLPRWDPHGRIPILLSDTSATRARGYAYPEWPIHSRCAGETGRMSLIWMDGRALFHSSLVQQAALLATSTHETAHLADFGARAPAARADAGSWRDWTVEGYADLVRHLWTQPGESPSVTANADSVPSRRFEHGVRMRSLCGLSVPREKLRRIDDALDYPAACQMVSALISRAVARGQPLEKVLQTWSSLPERLTFTGVSNALSRESRPPNQVVGEWLISWYADEMPGSSRSIQDPMWNLRAFFPASDLVDATLNPWGGSRAVKLQGLDASYILLHTDGPSRLAFTSPDGEPMSTDLTDLVLLRVE